MLKAENYNKGLICTDIEGCIACNKCIYECPVLKSNVSVPHKGKYKICVDEGECILCGTCMDTCVHDARKYRDDTTAFFKDLKKGKEINVIIAPSFFLNYPDNYKKILGHLKKLGVKAFYSASIGVDITVWGYLHYLKDSKKDYISQPCPSIVYHIEKHQPQIVKDLIPIHSPMMCTAIYLKKYSKIEGDFAFLSPCIAKKIEIQSPRGEGLVKHCVTFRGLMDHVNADDIASADEYTGSLIKATSIAGPGGLKEHLEYYLGHDAVILQVEGERRAYEFLKSLEVYKRDGNEHMPALIDILNCKYGCSQGTGTQSRSAFRTDIAYNTLLARKKKHKNTVLKTSEQRQEELNSKLNDLKLKDFVCKYEAREQKKSTNFNAEIEKVFKENLLKLTDNEQHIDCSACGYKTCRDMAEAIALGINHHDNCIYYIKNNLADTLEEKTSAENELRSLINIMPLAVAITNQKLKVVECNQEALNLFECATKNDYKNRYRLLWPKFQPDGSLSQEKAFEYRQIALEEGTSRFEWTYLLDSGETIPCEVVLMRSKWRGEVHVISFIRDMREQHELKDTLLKLEESGKREKRANQAKTKFLARMSHEIRTPMNSVMGITELQLRKDSHPPETEEAFSRIYNSSGLLLSIINDILDLSKVEAGKMEILPTEYDSASMIVDTVQLNLMFVDDKPIDFTLHVDKNLPAILIGDETRVKQILNNFLSNAFKYTFEGEVKLSLGVEKKSGDEVIIVVRVSDTGQGMSTEQMDELFGEFTRFNVESNRDIEGSGLGLTIANQLTKMMGGKIEVESIKHKGTTFTVFIPQKIKNDIVLGEEVAKSLQNFDETQNSIKKLATLDREPMPYGRVLVVDDVESNLYVAKGFLMPYKLTVDTVESGFAVLEKINEGNEYDIILMDHMMPRMDGMETTKKLRKNGYKRPIIALTANAFSDMAEMFMQNGFDGYATKPIDINQLDNYLMKYIYDIQSPEVIEKANRAKQASKEWRDKGLSAIKRLQKEKPVETKNMEFLRKQMTVISDACDFYETEDAFDAVQELQHQKYPSQIMDILDKITKLLKNGDLKEVGELAQQILNT